MSPAIDPTVREPRLRHRRTAWSPRRRRGAGWLAVVALVAGAAGVGVLRSADAGVAGAASSFVPITPCRLLDTRPGELNVGQRSTPLGAGETHTVTATGESGDCDLPVSATAVAMNVVAIEPTASSYLTVFPSDVARPTSSSLNWVAGQAPTANAVTSALGGSGGLSLFNLAGTVHLAVDVVGYFVATEVPAGEPGQPGAQGPAGPRGASAQPANVIQVTQSGGRFTSVSAALASITDASADNRYVVLVAPGIYDEIAPIVLQDFVDVVGAGVNATIVRGYSTDGVIQVADASATVSDMTVLAVEGVGIVHDAPGTDLFRLRDVKIMTTGGTVAVGLKSWGRTEGERVEFAMTGAPVAWAVQSEGDLRLTGVRIGIQADACFGFEVGGPATLIDVQMTTVQCDIGAGLRLTTTEVSVEDAWFDLEFDSGGTGVLLANSTFTARRLKVDITGPSVDVALVSGGSWWTIADSDIRSDDIGILGNSDGSTTERLVDSILVGGSGGLDDKCVDVTLADFTPYTCL